MNITKQTATSKNQILQYFRDRSTEFLSEVNVEFGNREYKKKAKSLNTLLVQAKVTLIEIIEQKSKKENWSNQETLECILMVTYCNYVVMLEVRHSVWPYEYMAFSRRIGELWEPFCKLALNIQSMNWNYSFHPFLWMLRNNLLTKFKIISMSFQ